MERGIDYNRNNLYNDRPISFNNSDYKNNGNRFIKIILLLIAAMMILGFLIFKNVGKDVELKLSYAKFNEVTDDDLKEIKESRGFKEVYLDEDGYVIVKTDKKNYIKYKAYYKDEVIAYREEMLADPEFNKYIANVEYNKDYSTANIYMKIVDFEAEAENTESYEDLGELMGEAIVYELIPAYSAIAFGGTLQTYKEICQADYEVTVNIYNNDTGETIESYTYIEILSLLDEFKDFNATDYSLDYVESTDAEYNPENDPYFIDVNSTLYDNNGVKIYFKNIRSGDFGLELSFYIENSSNRNIIIESSNEKDSSINGFKIDASVYISLDAGLKCNDIGNIYSDELVINNITSIKNMRIYFEIQDADTYDLLDTFTYAYSKNN